MIVIDPLILLNIEIVDASYSMAVRLAPSKAKYVSAPKLTYLLKSVQDLLQRGLNNRSFVVNAQDHP